MPKYILTDNGVIENGTVVVKDGIIQYVGSGIFNFPDAAATPLIIKSNSLILSPGFINAHDHIDYNQMYPAPEVQSDYADTAHRYDQRNDWRRGKRGHKEIPDASDTSRPIVAWNELRQLISGTTTIVSKGGVSGLARNLGNESSKVSKPDFRREGLESPGVVYQTFPLGDTGGDQHDSGINYPHHPSPNDVDGVIYVAHVAEGVDKMARNEFINLSQTDSAKYGDSIVHSYDILGPNIMFIHMIGLLYEDAVLAKKNNVNIAWSPRSNISLYGNTAPVPLYKALGLNICLSTDWTCSGSMNLLRELDLVYELNVGYFDSIFSGKEMWQMVTVNPAKALQVSDKIGDIKKGMMADLVGVRMWSEGGTDDPYEMTVRSPIEYVDLVMRGGKIIYGDSALIADMPPSTGGKWESLDTCYSTKLCDISETGFSYDALKKLNAKNYPLCFRGAPPDEPTGHLVRKYDPQCPKQGIYPVYTVDEDYDQDGVKNKDDNAPHVFDPLRPVDILNGRGQIPVGASGAAETR